MFIWYINILPFFVIYIFISISQRTSEEKLSNSLNSVSDGHGVNGGLRSSGRKAGLSNFFHVNTFPSFKRHNSSDDTNNINSNLSNGDLTAKDKMKRNNSYTQVSGRCGSFLGLFSGVAKLFSQLLSEIPAIHWDFTIIKWVIN